jgi:hypothetical protein
MGYTTRSKFPTVIDQLDITNYDHPKSHKSYAESGSLVTMNIAVRIVYTLHRLVPCTHE